MLEISIYWEWSCFRFLHCTNRCLCVGARFMCIFGVLVLLVQVEFVTTISDDPSRIFRVDGGSVLCKRWHWNRFCIFSTTEVTTFLLVTASITVLDENLVQDGIIGLFGIMVRLKSCHRSFIIKVYWLCHQRTPFTLQSFDVIETNDIKTSSRWFRAAQSAYTFPLRCGMAPTPGKTGKTLFQTHIYRIWIINPYIVCIHPSRRRLCSAAVCTHNFFSLLPVWTGKSYFLWG